jgi:DNA polymerase III epsilon subunit-like protein
MSKQSVICFDFETGGLDRKEGKHAEKYPITEVAMVTFNLDTFEEISRYQTLVKPYNDLTLDPEAMNVTGLKVEQLWSEGRELKTVVKEMRDEIKKGGTNARSRPIMMGHNVPFDMGFLRYIFKDQGMDVNQFINEVQLDTLTLAKMTWPGKTRYNLGACMEHAGIQLIDAHRAMNDVLGTKALFQHMTTRMRTSTGGTVGSSEGKPFRETFKFNS